MSDIQELDLMLFNTGAVIVKIIAELQQYLKDNFTKLEVRGQEFPRTITIVWIPFGVAVRIQFESGHIVAGVYQPDDLTKYPTEYQERIAECDAIIKREMGRLRGDEK